MATKLPYLNVLEVDSVNKEDVSRAIVIDKDEYVKALDIEQITTYQGLSNKPKINGVELNGDMSLDELNVASKDELDKVKTDLAEVEDSIPSFESIQNRIDDSLLNYPTKTEVTEEIIDSTKNKADKSEIPTKVSQLDNDKGYLTSIPSQYVTDDELNEAIAGLNNQIDDIQTVLDSDYYVNIAPNYTFESNTTVSRDITGTYYNQIKDAIADNKKVLAAIVDGAVKTFNLIEQGEYNLRFASYIVDASGVLTYYIVLTEVQAGFPPDNVTVEYKLTYQSEYSTYPTADLTGYATEQWVEDQGYLTTVPSEYVTETELNTKQDKLTQGDNINITNNVISWVAPEVQFVNNIFTDDQSLKYTITDFNGGYTEKEFPLATTESAGLMSPEDKSKLDAGITGTTNYNDLTNKPSIDGITLEGNKRYSELGLASSASVTSLDAQVIKRYMGASTVNQITLIRVLTQEEYDSLGEYDNETQYLIV